MSVFITFAAALLIFGAVIAIHEFGHFAVAKLCGVQVNEFSIGMGPTLIKTYRKGTQYTLRLLPVGGFVALEGEESPESEQAEGGSGDDDGPDIPPEVLAQRTGKPLNEAAVWQRMLVMAAGAVMNFVLGFVVLLLLISLRSEPSPARSSMPWRTTPLRPDRPAGRRRDRGRQRAALLRGQRYALRAYAHRELPRRLHRPPGRQARGAAGRPVRHLAG